jgi:hypothetical protein
LSAVAALRCPPPASKNMKSIFFICKPNYPMAPSKPVTNVCSPVHIRVTRTGSNGARSIGGTINNPGGERLLFWMAALNYGGEPLGSAV